MPLQWPPAQQNNKNGIIAPVRAKTAQIDKDLPRYKKVQKDNADPQSTEGNLIIEYFDKGNIKKMTTWYYMETGKLTEICYFEHGMPLFYYSKYQKYDVPIYIRNMMSRFILKVQKR